MTAMHTHACVVRRDGGQRPSFDVHELPLSNSIHQPLIKSLLTFEFNAQVSFAFILAKSHLKNDTVPPRSQIHPSKFSTTPSNDWQSRASSHAWVIGYKRPDKNLSKREACLHDTIFIVDDDQGF